MSFHKPNMSTISATLLVVPQERDVPDARRRYPHWWVCSAATPLTGHRFDHIVMDDRLNTVEHTALWQHMVTKLKREPFALKILSHVDTFSDMC